MGKENDKDNGGATNMAKIFGAIDECRGDLKAVMAAADVDRVIILAKEAVRRSENVAKCWPPSVVACVLQATSLGLEIGVNGEAYLNSGWSTKRKRNECQLIPGYQGLMKLARNSGLIKNFATHIVYTADEFQIELGLEDKIHHVPHLGSDRGDPRLVYTVARFSDGSYHVEYMLWSEIMEIKATTKSKNNDGKIVGPWADHENEMARKTVVRRASKYWPKSVEMSAAIALDNAVAAGINQDLDYATARANTFQVPTGASEPIHEPESMSGRPASTEGRDGGNVSSTEDERGTSDEVQMRERAASWATILPKLPQGLYEALATIAPSDLSPDETRPLQKLRGLLAKKDCDPARAMRDLWGPEIADAPARLRPAFAHYLGLPGVPAGSPEPAPKQGEGLREQTVQGAGGQVSGPPQGEVVVIAAGQLRLLTARVKASKDAEAEAKTLAHFKIATLAELPADKINDALGFIVGLGKS